jgi:RNA polymerase sigma factor (sigma-70 family)
MKRTCALGCDARSPPPGDVDDMIQETYCRLAALATSTTSESRAPISSRPRGAWPWSSFGAPGGADRDRQRKSTRWTSNLESRRPSASPAGRRELARVQSLIAALPERCRRIFEMRKIEGLPQREIARRMGVTENMVENESVRGLRAILAALAEQ